MTSLRSLGAPVLSVVALLELVGCAAPAKPATDSATVAPRRAAAAPSVLTPLLPGGVVGSSLVIERSPSATDAPASTATDELAATRRPLEPRPALSPLPDDVARLLAEAAEQLSQGDVERARAAAAQASAFAPSRPEPIELGLLAELASGDGERVREAVATLASADPSNPIVVAFDGLDACQRGDDGTALASLGWFIGDGALRRRGAAIPLPTAVAELEEQAAVCALRLGRPAIALVALEAAAAMRSDDRESRRILALLESDALLALGRTAESRAALDAVSDASSSNDPLAQLAALRQDRADLMAGAPERAIAAALEGFRRQPLDDFRLWRVATLLRLDCIRSEAMPSRGAVDRVAPWGREAGRLELVDALAAGSGRAGRVARALPAVEDDPMAFAIGLAALQVDSPTSAVESVVEAAVAAVERGAERADRVALALLGSGLEPDEIDGGLGLAGRGAVADAIRSRVLARIGLVEEAYRVADLACSRDRASAAALAAAALAAAELGDETLLDEIDAAAIAGEVRIGESLGRAWSRLGRLDRAEDRRRRLGSRPAAEPTGTSGAASPAGSSSVEPSSIDALLATARALDLRRIPIALEAVALAEALDPSRESALVLLEPLRARAAPGALAAYARAAAAEAPALVARRRLVLELAGDPPPVIDADPDQPPSAKTLSARVDEAILATGAARARLERSRAESRPRTSEAIAALASVEARSDRCKDAFALLEMAATREPPATSALGARGILRSAVEAGAREPAGAPRMWKVAARVLPIARELDAGDVGRIALLWSASGEGIDPLRRAVSTLVDRLRLEELDLARVRGTLGALRDAAGDSLPAAELAAALAGETRLPLALRSALGATAIALFAESGGSAGSSRDLVLRLAETGATPLRRSPDEILGPAEALVRAASVHDLLSDAAGNRTLLRAALELQPGFGDAMNNLAYLDVEQGAVTDETLLLAERAAAQAPDDPAVLDTLACVRLQQGRLRDDAGGPGAITLFRQALRIRPEDPSLSTLDRLGDALWHDGDEQGAIRCWQQVGQVAALRYPPEAIARSLLDYQQREIGLRLVDPVEYVRRRYGSVVDRAEAKLRQVAAGEPPSLGLRAGRDG